MKLFLRNILILLPFSAAVCSCSLAKSDADFSFNDVHKGRILITGTVSELGSAQPLKDIKITFKAYLPDNSGATLILTDEVYSGNDGIYVINASAVKTPLLCKIIAEDMNSVYESQTHDISVTWSGPSYDKKNTSFVVNDSHFQLQKIRIQ